MIGQRMMIGAIGGWAQWQITVNTTDAGTGKKTGIPVQLFDQPDVVVKVNWGDGQTDILTSDSFVSAGQTLPSIHEYAEDGSYTITLQIKNAERMFWYYWGSNLSSYDPNNKGNLFCFRKTLVSIDTPIPLSAGTRRYNSNQWDIQYNQLTRMLYYCQKLEYIHPEVFYEYSQLTELSYQFSQSPLLLDFTIKISSENITNVESFCTNASGINRNVYVKSGSATESAFSSIAQAKSLTVIGE